MDNNQLGEIGDTIKIIKDETMHCIPIGTILTIKQICIYAGSRITDKKRGVKAKELEGMDMIIGPKDYIVVKSKNYLQMGIWA